LVLRQLGIEIDSIPGRGYRFRYPVESLNPDTIRTALIQYPELSDLDVQVEFVVDSTNTVLLRQARLGAGNNKPRVLFSELQTAGRGRWGRTWFTTFGGCLCLSLMWTFPASGIVLGGLSIAIAVSLAELLRLQLGLMVDVKWPNDVLYNGRKLAGVLIEVTGELSSSCVAVIGVGLNLRLDEVAIAKIDQPTQDLHGLVGHAALERNCFAASLTAHLVQACQLFQREGLTPFRALWKQYDALADRMVSVQLPDRIIDGCARGIDEYGALRLETETGDVSCFSGEVQLKIRA
jgi:BirA family biotin operon repressor/biotin-[acetyl-CoA-carboxylase] ligase